MRRITTLVLSTLFLFITNTSSAQTGPGGVGNSSNIEAWMDAARLTGLSNNDPVSSWTDFSGNNNHATQATGASQPLYLTNQINSLPALNFDGTNDFLNFTTNITTGDITLFTIYTSNKVNQGGVLNTQKHFLLTKNNFASVLYVSPNTRYDIAKGNGSFSVFSLQTDGAVSGSSLNLTNGSNSLSFTRNSLSNSSTSRIGNFNNLVYLQGQMAEIIVFNEVLNSAKRKIVSNHLAAKYNLTAEQNLYAFKTSNGNQVMGVGQEADGSHTVARGLDSLEISNPTTLNNGDYLLIGNDGADFSTSASVPGGIVERWNRVWRVDKTGTPGNIDMEFFLGSSGFASVSNYVILTENVDGDFSNGGTSVLSSIPSFNAANNSIIFNNVDLVDGSYFTLAESSGDIESIRSGSWNNVSTWSCNCIPALGDIVTIASPFSVTVDANAFARDLTIENGAALSFSGNDTLSLNGDLLISASTTFNSGTLAAVGTAGVQSFTNSSSSNLALHNLFSSNPNGLDIITGDWSLSNSLQISAGGLDVSGANSFTLTSTPSATSQILPSMSNAFTGNFTVQRYISARNANYANLSSPVQNATIADWDDDLYMSGVNGLDGNATFGFGGPIYYSVYTYNYQLDKHDTITSTTTALVPGKGYELWLADNNTSYNGGTIDVVGVPTSGDNINPLVNEGWNFLGNPYHSFIEYDSIITSTWVPNNYYIFNTDNGSYDFFDGAGKPAIAPSQGFWIRKISGGTKAVDFRESGKVNSTSSSFLRVKAKQEFKLSIQNNMNPFKHQAGFKFSSIASHQIDEKDAYYLPSPEKKAPAIYSKATNSEEGLILNNLNAFEESQVIPIEIYAGVAGNYEINAEQVDQIYKYYDCIYLKDKEKSEAIDLSIQPNYSFEALEGTHNRFELVLSNNPLNCEKLLEADDSYSQDLSTSLSLRNGNGIWYLDYTLPEASTQVEVEVYNMAGQLVKAGISFSASNAGTYPLRDLQDLSGIYLIRVKSSNKMLNKTIQL